ncbi:hypothetical protein J7M28_02625 [bacterium]|nr:hypothetical protein [bacterium]
MAEEVVVLYFVEDPAQESFITTVIRRIADGEGIPAQRVSLSGWAVQDGSKAIAEFKHFVKEAGDDLWASADILAVGFDANREGVTERRKQLRMITKPLDIALQDRIAFAVPDPHIERWYLEDQHAFNSVFGPGSAPAKPPYKSDKDYYKQTLHDAIAKTGQNSLLGASAYGEDIALAVNFDVLSRDRGFKLFLKELKAAFRHLQSTIDQ